VILAACRVSGSPGAPRYLSSVLPGGGGEEGAGGAAGGGDGEPEVGLDSVMGVTWAWGDLAIVSVPAFSDACLLRWIMSYTS